MPRLIKIIALLLAALWLPATVHCRLENLGLDALLSCADQATESAHADQEDCANDSCEALESGQFTAARSELDFAVLAPLACACHLCLYLTAPLDPAGEIAPTRQIETLPLQRTWQFCRRAAPLSRAPSLVG